MKFATNVDNGLKQNSLNVFIVSLYFVRDAEKKKLNIIGVVVSFRYTRKKEKQMKKTLEQLKKEYGGRFPSCSFPGRYQIVYYCEDGGVLCPDCANGENGSEASVNQDDPQWKLVDSGFHWEGPVLLCDHCRKEMESIYGDPSNSEKESNG